MIPRCATSAGSSVPPAGTWRRPTASSTPCATSPARSRPSPSSPRRSCPRRSPRAPTPWCSTSRSAAVPSCPHRPGRASWPRTMVELGEAHGVRTSALLTAMDTPLGRTAGNALEVAEAVEVLAGGGPSDVVEVTVALAAEMLASPGSTPTPLRPRRRPRHGHLAGDDLGARAATPTRNCHRADHVETVTSPADGVLHRLDARAVGVAAWRLGAGRARKEDPVSAAAGVVMRAKPGDRVTAGQPLLELHTDDPHRIEPAQAALADAIDRRPDPTVHQLVDHRTDHRMTEPATTPSTSSSPKPASTASARTSPTRVPGRGRRPHRRRRHRRRLQRRERQLRPVQLRRAHRPVRRRRWRALPAGRPRRELPRRRRLPTRHAHALRCLPPGHGRAPAARRAGDRRRCRHDSPSTSSPQPVPPLTRPAHRLRRGLGCAPAG
jgi:hypothetical protein